MCRPVWIPAGGVGGPGAADVSVPVVRSHGAPKQACPKLRGVPSRHLQGTCPPCASPAAQYIPHAFAIPVNYPVIWVCGHAAA